VRSKNQIAQSGIENYGNLFKPTKKVVTLYNTDALISMLN